jgi:hypothetical protein
LVHAAVFLGLSLHHLGGVVGHANRLASATRGQRGAFGTGL